MPLQQLEIDGGVAVHDRRFVAGIDVPQPAFAGQSLRLGHRLVHRRPVDDHLAAEGADRGDLAGGADSGTTITAREPTSRAP